MAPIWSFMEATNDLPRQRAERDEQPAKKAAKQAEKAEVPGRTGGACGGKKRKGARQRLAGSQWKQGAPRPEDEDPHVQEGADRGAPLTEVRPSATFLFHFLVLTPICFL